MSFSGTPLSPAAIAVNRFGLGARPDEAAPSEPRQWLVKQLDLFELMPSCLASLPDAGVLVQRYRALQRDRQQSANDPSDLKTARQAFAKNARDLYRAAVAARVESALNTPAPFIERLVHFWSNHFCISADNARIAAYAGAFERDVIRPHVLGRFSDMLLAAEQHPAMLFYLNQATSIGPDSVAAQRAEQHQPAHRRGLNENLGREILELHTLGARSGYTQADVTEFARALTGWTIASRGAGPGNPDDFAFRPAQHEPGARIILGRRYEADGEDQAKAILLDLARLPATATHVATKLACHFAGDTPPPALVRRLAATFTTTAGDLPSLYRTLVAAPECWAPQPLKFKTPWEWTVSAWRGLGVFEPQDTHPAALELQLGQPVWTPGSPAGWDDTAATWAAPDALMRRVDAAARLAAPFGDRFDARQLGPRLMPASLSPATAQQVMHAESPASALALLLVSPEFLRR